MNDTNHFECRDGWCTCEPSKRSYPSDVTEFEFPCACGATIPHIHCVVCGGVIEKPTEEQRKMFDRDAYLAAPSWHHPECQCNQCYYGADEALRVFHPSEY